MRNKWIVFLLLILSPSAFGLNDKPKTLSEEISNLLEHEMTSAEIGIVVADANSGKTIYEHNGFKLFTPASNTKLFSAAAALYELGPEYKFQTAIYVNKKNITQKTLKGNLYIHFSGDPSLRIKHLSKLITQVANAGILKIKGDIILDTSDFNGPNYAPGWSQEDLNWYFNAPITTIILNQNTIDVNLIPGSKLGNKAKAVLVKEKLAPFIKLNTDVDTVTYPESMNSCSLEINITQHNDVTLTGCWPISDQAKTLHIAIKNPNLFAKAIIKRELKKQGLKFTGTIKEGAMPTGLNQIALKESAPLKLLLQTLLKDSNNIYAECITKTLGKHSYNEGSFINGVNAITDILHKKVNLDAEKYVLKDGSGASRYTLLSPKQIVRLLFVIHHTPDLASIYEQALPESGQDGTLKHRMQSFDLRGKIAAKTGSMSGVSSLSGILTDRNHHQMIFAIMINHFVGEISEAKMLQAKIASILYSGEP